MTSCEKCWEDAHSYPHDTLTRYEQLLQERHCDPCTPEQQAGRMARECQTCKRMTLHQYTGKCMNPECRPPEKP